MNWTISDWEFLIIASNLVMTVALSLFMLYLRSVFVTHRTHEVLAARVERHSERLNLGDTRFGLLDQRIASVPSADALHRLDLMMARLDGKIGALTIELQGLQKLNDMVQRQMGVMDDYLREREHRA
jgi:hypothetical protein